MKNNSNYFLRYCENWFMLVSVHMSNPTQNQHVNPLMAEILNRSAAISILNSAQPEVMGDMEPIHPKSVIEEFIDLVVASRCECDGELVWDEYPVGGYVKTSHYCPVHDDCDCCGEVKGVKKDRTLTVAGRPAWVCEECYLLCDDHAVKDCAVCAERAKQPEMRFI